jgi:hypothetical protein
MLKRNKLSALDTLKRVLIALAGVVALLHLAAIILSVNSPGDQTNQLIAWFDLDGERNIPTVYSGLILGCCAFISLLLSTQKNRPKERLRWAFLALLFFYLAFDEILVIHEVFAEPIRDFLSIAADSPLFHAWVIPAAVIGLAIAGFAIFIRHHSEISQLQRAIFVYIAILAAGVIFLEILGTQFYFTHAVYKLGPVLVEEMFEIAMSSLILYKLASATNLKIPPAKEFGIVKEVN